MKRKRSTRSNGQQKSSKTSIDLQNTIPKIKDGDKVSGTLFFNVRRALIYKTLDRKLKMEIKWVVHCCLTSGEHFFSYIMARTSCISMGRSPLCTRPTRLNWIFIVLAQWNNSSRIDKCPLSLFRFSPSHKK